jgi:hypothetical protein
MGRIALIGLANRIERLASARTVFIRYWVLVKAT